MNLDKAIRQLDDEMTRKFILDTEKNTLHVFKNPFPAESDTHKALAIKRGLNPAMVKGGRLKVVENKLTFRSGSTTVYSASPSDIDKFQGEVEVF